MESMVQESRIKKSKGSALVKRKKKLKKRAEKKQKEAQKKQQIKAQKKKWKQGTHLPLASPAQEEQPQQTQQDAGPGSKPQPSNGARHQQKKEKKEWKAMDSAQQPANGAEPAGSAPALVHPHEAPASQKKIKKKKKRQAAELQAEAEPPSISSTIAANAEPDATAAAPPKKKQKSQGSKGMQAAVLATMAEVGDKEAAQRGRPIQKAIYAEHAAIAAMSDAEVAAWQSERSTVVDGCDLRPVPAFEHAGPAPACLLCMCPSACMPSECPCMRDICSQP